MKIGSNVNFVQGLGISSNTPKGTSNTKTATPAMDPQSASLEISDEALLLQRKNAIMMMSFKVGNVFEVLNATDIDREAAKAEAEKLTAAMPIELRVSAHDGNMHNMLIDVGFHQNHNVANTIGVFLQAYGTTTAIGKPVSLEERAMMREAGLRMAQHVADNFLDAATAKEFMRIAHRMMEDDIKVEQGFRWDENGNPIPPHQIDREFGLLSTGELITQDMLFVMERWGITQEEKEAILRILGAAHDFMAKENSGLRLTNPDFFNAEVRRLQEEAWNLRVMFEDAANAMGFNNRSVQIEWATRRNNEFFARAVQIRSDIDSTIRNFDTLISDDKFTSIHDWQDRLQTAISDERNQPKRLS